MWKPTDYVRGILFLIWWPGICFFLLHNAVASTSLLRPLRHVHLYDVAKAQSHRQIDSKDAQEQLIHILPDMGDGSFWIGNALLYQRCDRRSTVIDARSEPYAGAIRVIKS